MHKELLQRSRSSLEHMRASHAKLKEALLLAKKRQQDCVNIDKTRLVNLKSEVEEGRFIVFHNNLHPESKSN